MRKFRRKAGFFIGLFCLGTAAVVLAAGLYCQWRQAGLNKKLIEAVRYQRHEEEGTLLQAGANPDIRIPDRDNPFDFKRTLLSILGIVRSEERADADTPLKMAIRNADRVGVELLLIHHANPNARYADGVTPLMLAVDAPRHAYDITERLIQAGAFVDAKDNYGRSAFDVVTGGGVPSRDLVLLLLPYERNIAAQDASHIDCLVWAANLGYTDIVDKLLKMGINVNGRDSTAHTALLRAAAADNIDVVRILLKYGASVWPTDRDGRSALDCAERGTATYNLLRSIVRQKTWE